MSKPNTATQALIESIPEHLWDELRELRSQVTKTRGWTPLDDDARIAGDAYFDLVKHIHETYGITLWSMAIHLGLNGRTIKHWMKSHGYGDKPPSLKAYQGVLTKRGGTLGTRRLGEFCKHGHRLDAGTLAEYVRSNGHTQRVCLKCRKNQYTASRAKS